MLSDAGFNKDCGLLPCEFVFDYSKAIFVAGYKAAFLGTVLSLSPLYL